MSNFDMILTYYDGGSLRLQSGSLSLLVDPQSNRLKADVILRTLTPTNLFESRTDSGSETDISLPGEYEVQGIEIAGIQINKESTEKFLKVAYRVHWEDLSFVFLGHASKIPDPGIIEFLGDPDVLVLPVAGGHFLEPEAAHKLAKQFEPKLIVPTFHKAPYAFMKTFGGKIEVLDKFVFRKKDIEKEKAKVILLKSASS